MFFKVVSETFMRLELLSSRLEITELLAQLLKKATPLEANIITNFCLGELNPPYKKIQFNIAEKTIVVVLSKLLELSADEIITIMRKTGDFGDVLVQGKFQDTELNVLDVYNRLQQLQEFGGTGSQELRINALENLLKDLDAQSAKYIVRILLNKLRLGFSDMTIIDALSWMEVGSKKERAVIEHAYNICADIGFIAQHLKESGLDALRGMKIRVGIPIRPAAAERLSSPQEVIDKLGPSVAQPKLDGFRLQIHIDNRNNQKKIFFFSRNLQDMSDIFPELHTALLKINVESCILEGEAIGIDTSTGELLPFQETIKRKRKHGIEEAQIEYPLKLFIFDILYLNGNSLLGEKHEQRRAQLVSIFKGINDTVQVISERIINTSKELTDYFNEVIQVGLEGLIVKRTDAIYQPGKRNFNWVKLKRHQSGQLEDSIDGVVLGYYSGGGKRSGFGIGAFLIGVYNKAEDSYQTIAKIGTGLTDAEWIELKKKCDELMTAEKPKNVECPKELTPLVWVTPRLVVEVKADEITLSPLHTAGKTPTHAGYALRFPRFINYRIEKSAVDSTEVNEIRKMFKAQMARQ